MGMGRAVTHNPKDGIGGVDKKKLTLFVEQAELMVGEEIAEELGTMGHAERLETVALTPMTQGERQTDGVGIEKGRVCAENDECGCKRHGGSVPF